LVFLEIRKSGVLIAERDIIHGEAAVFVRELERASTLATQRP
jgi:hypothetical protein